MRLLDLLRRNSTRIFLPYTFLIINEKSGERFVVTGIALKACRLIADKKCKEKGWNLDHVRSEELL